MKSGDTLLVYVVDDDEAVRDSLGLLLSSVDIGYQLFESGDAFLEAYSPAWHGCVLLDIRMPGTNGIDVQVRLRELSCQLPIVFVTGHGDVPMAVDAMHSGAFDFIQKPYREQELLERIRRAFDAHQQLSDEAEVSEALQRRLKSLTPREREIMQHVVKGSANKVIAMDLDLSQRTVEVHRARVMEKMQAASLAELVRMSIRASV